MTQLEVLRAGVATTIQDAGRAGYADLGVPTSGAVDAQLRSLVNRLVGNPADAAVLETAGGLEVRVDGPGLVATSAELTARSVMAGACVQVDPAPTELWGYLAVRGGIDVEPVLGSRSQDTRSGLGPDPVVDGLRLPIGGDPRSAISVDQVPPLDREGPIRIWPGPRLDWFTPGAFDVLSSRIWAVTAEVSRVGVRLSGAELERVHLGELPSEGLVLGAIQVPPDGVPVVMLADHPTTGGYPVIAVVDPRDVGRMAQRRSGSTVAFRRARRSAGA